MPIIRPVLTLAVGMAVLLVGQAGAATPHKANSVCHLIADASGDGNGKDTGDLSPFPLPVGPKTSPVPFPVVNVGPSSDALDITSADIAADKKYVSIVIRVKKLALSDPTASPTGLRWQFSFTAEENVLTMSAHSNPSGPPTFDAYYIDPITGGGALYPGGVTGKLDLAKNEVHIIAPTSLFAAQATIKKGSKLTNLFALSKAEVYIPEVTHKFGDGALEELSFGNDYGTTTKSYVDGTPSCVTPGK